MRRLILALFLFACSAALCAQQTLNNDAVIKLTKAGLTPELIISTINATPGSYDTSPDGIIALKKAGVSDKVVAALLSKNSGAPASAGSEETGLPAAVDTIGIYYKDQDGSWKEVSVEFVSYKSSTMGMIKHVGTAGLVHDDRSGLVGGTHSHLQLKTPAEFILYLPEGRSPSEYQLIRMRPDADARAFHAQGRATAHESANTPHDNVDFTSRKIAPRAYAVTIDSGIGKGEYGFLPPADTSEKNPGSGKIYTFTIADSVSQ